MPHCLKTPCADPSCPALVHGTYCDDHKAKAGQYDRDRGSASARGYGHRWRKYRRLYLRENPLCVSCLEKDIVTASNEVDHIQPVRGPDDWTFWDPENHRALCKPCHSRKTAQEGQKPSIRVTIVCGPPGSGKTNWVKERAHWGDLIVDLDALFQAISGLPAYEKPLALLPFVFSARDAILDRLCRASEIGRAWVITSGAHSDERERLKSKLKAEVVLLKVPATECLRRIRDDERRRDTWESWKPIVERWWKEFDGEK